MLTPYLHRLLQKGFLTIEEAEIAIDLILEKIDSPQVPALLALLRYRGEAPEEIAGMVRALEKKARSVSLAYPTLDIVGTGGDLANTVNISTGSAILAAACGIPIAKHGNRSVSSQSGSADLLEALGISMESSQEYLENCLERASIAFLFAPHFHPALKDLKDLRKSLKFPTVFNLLGPLLNPAKPQFALIGIADPHFLERIAEFIAKFGEKKRALVFHGSGLDELSSLGKASAYLIEDGKKTFLELDPLALGFTPCTLKELQGGDAKQNALLLQEAFAGKQGAISDALIFNAGAALWIFGKESSLLEGIETARSCLKKGKALDTLEKWKLVSLQKKESICS